MRVQQQTELKNLSYFSYCVKCKQYEIDFDSIVLLFRLKLN